MKQACVPLKFIRLIKVMAAVIILSNPHLFAKLFTLFYRFFVRACQSHSGTIKEHELGECKGTHKKWMRQPRNVFAVLSSMRIFSLIVHDLQYHKFRKRKNKNLFFFRASYARKPSSLANRMRILRKAFT